MNILILTTSLCGGGAERAASVLASALSRRHAVWVVCTRPEGNWNGTYAVAPEVNVLEPEFPVPFRSKRGLKWLRYLIRCRKRRLVISGMKKEFGIDLCISFLAEPNFDNVRSVQDEKTVITVHNIYRTPVRKFWLWRLMDRFLMTCAGRRADRVVTVSESIGLEQAQWYHVPKQKLRTIYNPIDTEAIRVAAGQPTGHAAFDAFRARHDILFLSAGRLVEQKGYGHLIRAFRDVSAAHPGAGLVILGEGHLREKLQQLISVCALTDHVLLPGFFKEPFPFYGKADVFVMSSLYEGFSIAMLEAMACSLPVILTDCNSGPRELCAPDTGITRRTDTVEQAAWGILTPVCSGNTVFTDGPSEPEEKCLAGAMNQLVSDPRLRETYALRSLTRAQDFSIERVISEWEDLAEELCGRHPR